MRLTDRRPTVFHQSGVIHILKRSVLNQEEKCVLKFAAVRYLLYRCGESMLCLKYQFIIHASPVPLFVFPTA